MWGLCSPSRMSIISQTLASFSPSARSLILPLLTKTVLLRLELKVEIKNTGFGITKMQFWLVIWTDYSK